MAKQLAMQIEYQKCRRWGHCWDDAVPVNKGGRKILGGPRVFLKCDRCGMTRDDIYDYTGRVAARNYDQPANYKLSRDESPTTEQLNLSLATIVKASQRQGTPTKRVPRQQPAAATRRRQPAHPPKAQRRRHLAGSSR